MIFGLNGKLFWRYGWINIKKILITGASGFIGRHVTQEMIKRGYTVYAPSIMPTGIKRSGLIESKLDFFNTAKLVKYLETHQFKNLIHLAWYVGPKCHISPYNMDWLNISLELLKLFAVNGGKKFLGAGSVSEYDFSCGLLQEDKTPLTNPSLYGQTKAALYNVGKIFCQQQDISFKWARIFNLYGPYERTARLMPSVISSMLKGEDVKVSPCTKFLDYLHVEDTARGICQFFESNVTGAVNIASGEPIQLRYMVEEMARLTNFKGNILWGAIKENFAAPVIVGSNTRLMQEVGWKPVYTLQTGLEQTINWWREHLK